MKKTYMRKIAVLTATSLITLLGFSFDNLKVYATDTALTQKGTGTMGWHATSYSSGFTEDRMIANSDWIAKNLKDSGYEYICLDGWINDGIDHNENGYVVRYKTWAHDFAYWANYLHAKGLKLGVYYNPTWVLKSIADDPKVKVVGTDIPIKNIIHSDDPSKSFQDWYMVDPSLPGAEQYVKGMVNYYKSVDADLLKVDFIRYIDDAYGTDATTNVYRWMREAAGNDFIIYYANEKNIDHAAAESQYADMIRASEDYRQDIWYHSSVRNRGQVNDNSWPPAYNLFDGLVWLSDRSGKGKVILDGDFSILASSTSDSEKKFRLSLLAMAGSSLNIGDNFSNIKNNDVYYQNWEITDLNKQGFIGKPLVQDVKNPLSQTWKGQLPDSTWVVGLFNREDTVQTRSIDFASDLGLTGNYQVSDMWTHAPVGAMSSYSADIEPHGVRLIKISKLNMEPNGAFFQGSQRVTFNSLDQQAEIHYTIDGSEPNANSPVYTGSIMIDKTTVVRAKIVKGEGQGNEVSAKFITSITDPIDKITANIQSIPAPDKGAQHIIMPAVPYGYTVTLKSSSRENVIKPDGTIVTPKMDTVVNLVFTVTRTSDGVTKDSVVPVNIRGNDNTYSLMFEGETVKSTTSAPTTQIITDNYASKGKFLQTKSTPKVSDWVELTLNVPTAGTYQASLGYKTYENEGTAQLYVDGKVQGSPIDEYASAQIMAAADLGDVTFTQAGDHKLRFVVTGKNAKSSSYHLAVDYIKLTPGADTVAAGITSIVPPDRGATALNLPTVPNGFTVAIKSSDNPDIINTDGTIQSPKRETTVNLVLSVTRMLDGSTAETVSIPVKLLSNDVTPPVTIAQADEQMQNGWYRTGANVTLTAQDDISGVARTEYKLSGDQNWTTYLAPIAFTNEGIYNLQYRSIDLEGNVESTKEQKIQIDKTAPIYTLTINGAVYGDGTVFMDDQTLTLNLAAEDTLSGVADQTMTVDDKTYTNSTPIDVAGKLGIHLLHLTINDAAGNMFEKTISINVGTSVQSIQNILKGYIASEDITGPLVSQLTNSLDQVEEDLNKALIEQATNHMQDFLKHMNNKAMQLNVSDKALSVLRTDAQALLAQWSK